MWVFQKEWAKIPIPPCTPPMPIIPALVLSPINVGPQTRVSDRQLPVELVEWEVQGPAQLGVVLSVYIRPLSTINQLINPFEQNLRLDVWQIDSRAYFTLNFKFKKCIQQYFNQGIAADIGMIMFDISKISSAAWNFCIYLAQSLSFTCFFIFLKTNQTFGMTAFHTLVFFFSKKWTRDMPIFYHENHDSVYVYETNFSTYTFLEETATRRVC